jgi:hypothetical protein
MIALLVLLTSALGAGLEWSWTQEKPSKYRLETTMVAPQGQTWPAEKNLVARVTETRLSLDTECTGSLDGKSWVVACNIGRVDIEGDAIPGGEATVEKVLQEYAGEIRGKTVGFRMGLDGRVRRFDIKGVATRNRNHGVVLDGVRQMLRRAFTPFDIQLPKKGDDKGKKWSQKGSPMVFEVMSSQGTAGGVALKHWVTGRDNDAVQIQTSGRAAVVDGATIETGTSSMIRISVAGNSQFNVNLGILDGSVVSTKTDHAASNMQGLSKDGPPRFSSRLSRIAEDGQIYGTSD